MPSQYERWLAAQQANQLSPTSFPASAHADEEHGDSHGHHEEYYHGIKLGHHSQYPHMHTTEKTWKIILKTIPVLLVFVALAFLLAFVDVWTPNGHSVASVVIAWLMGFLSFFAFIGIWFVRSWPPRIILGFIFSLGMYLLFWFVFWHSLVH